MIAARCFTVVVAAVVGHYNRRLPPYPVILCYNNSGRPDGGIGIRVRLKIEWSNPYGFKSHSGHHFFVVKKVAPPNARPNLLVVFCNLDTSWILCNLIGCGHLVLALGLAPAAYY